MTGTVAPEPRRPDEYAAGKIGGVCWTSMTYDKERGVLVTSKAHYRVGLRTACGRQWAHITDLRFYRAGTTEILPADPCGSCVRVTS